MKILRFPVFFSLLCLFFLCGCILLPVQGKEKLTAATVAKAPAATREEGRRRLKLLVEKFSRDPRALKMTEAELRRVYLDEFLRCLGWDVGNSRRKGLYEQDSVPEGRLFMSNSLRYVDYLQRIDDKCFMVEAKRAGVNIDKPQYKFQAKRYCYSSLKAEVVLLSNFKELRVLDVRTKPDFNRPDDGEIKIFNLNFKQYLENFSLLYETFGRESVAKGSIQRMLRKNNPGLSRVTVDETLIRMMDSLRLELAKDIYKNNPDITVDDLNEATHNLLNRILFCRILEDRNIESTGILRLKIAHYFGDALFAGNKKMSKPAVKSLHKFIIKEFTGRLKKRYNGVVFHPHSSDKLKVSDHVLRKAIMSLYPACKANPEGASFDFAAIPAEVMGKIYESYLGERIELKNGKVKLEPDPSVREVGGVFFTPENIGKFMVAHTISPLLKGKSPEQLTKIKILDPASGCGALLIQAAQLLFAHARKYYRANPQAIKHKDHEFPDAIIKKDGTVRLSPFVKMNLVKNCIFGVDIDPQSSEIAAMWLYILILENQDFSIVDQEREYKIPNRHRKKSRSFKLPDLNQNLVGGNSLAETDYSLLPAENKAVQAFDWDNNETKIEKIVKAGGFDVIIANPPYMGYLLMKRYIPNQLKYLRKKYKSMGYKQPDMAYAFVERGLQLLKPGGVLGYILTNRFIFNEAALPLRKMLSEIGNLCEIINFGGKTRIFKDAKVYTALLFAQKSRHEKVRYSKLKSPESLDAMLKSVANPEIETKGFYSTTVAQTDLKSGNWQIPASSDKALITAMNKCKQKIGDIAEVFKGINTGADDIFIFEVEKIKNELCFAKSKANPQGMWLEYDSLVRLVRGRGIKPYAPLKSFCYTFNCLNKQKEILSEEDLQKKYPKMYKYLLANKAVLKKRKYSGPWYSLRRPANLKLTSCPKIYAIIGGKTGIDEKGELAIKLSGVNSAVIMESEDITLYMLLGVLNSKTVYKYLKYSTSSFSGKPVYNTGSVDKIPIPDFNERTAPIYGQIDKLARHIVKLKAKSPNCDISKLEDKMEAYVQKLYFVK